MVKTKRTLMILFAILFVCVVFFVAFFVLENYSESIAEPIETISETEKPTEPPTEEPTQDPVEQLVDSMTLNEKVAQMIMVSCHEGIDVESASIYGVGGICLYSNSFEEKTKEEVVAMIEGYQQVSPFPMLISVDEEGGTVNRVSTNKNLRGAQFLSPQELFEQGGYELIKSDTIEKSQLLLSLGINVNLAPVCDVPLSEDNYIYDRCFSLNHKDTAEYVSTVVQAMKENGMGSVLKHFPGYGGSVDTHESMSYDDRKYSAFENGDFLPFISGIENGADCVLVSHNIVTCMDSEKPASLSKPIHDILRNELNFDGVIITDDLVMQGIQQFCDGESAALMAVKAGNDMIICEDYEGAINAIVAQVNEGEIEEERIDKSVYRILQWKQNLSLINT